MYTVIFYSYCMSVEHSKGQQALKEFRTVNVQSTAATFSDNEEPACRHEKEAIYSEGLGGRT